ncbi:hypothetical protein U1Q18_033995 [Sarracenia purpurea var. burkii]
MEDIPGKLHCLPKSTSSSLELARLRELGELANVSHVAESGPEPNQPKLSCYINHEIDKAKASNMSEVLRSPGAKSPTHVLPFLTQPNEGDVFSNSNGVCPKSEEFETLNQTKDRMAGSNEMDYGVGSKLQTFHKNRKSTCEVFAKKTEPIFYLISRRKSCYVRMG